MRAIIVMLIILASIACKNDNTHPTSTSTPLPEDVRQNNIEEATKIGDDKEEKTLMDHERMEQSEQALSELEEVEKGVESNTKYILNEKIDHDKAIIEKMEEIEEVITTEISEKEDSKNLENIKAPTTVLMHDGEDESELKMTIKKLNHDLFDQLLKKYVSGSGKVDYIGLKSEESNLDRYIMVISKNVPTDAWERKEAMAYWINAYNAFTIKLILENWPVKRIIDLHGGKPWDVKWIHLGDNTYSLNNIENDILRPRYKEGRIHFAVNCAAKSCPPLLNRAWTATNLNNNLENQARNFINNSQYNKIQASSLKLSSIFDWYGSDFDDLISFLNTYSTTPINSDASIEFNEYNWDLNN